MAAIVFFAIDAVFVWLLYKGYSTQEIIAQGWGARVRIYHRDSEPIMYWLTFGLYLILVTICTVVGLLIALSNIGHHAA